MLFRSLLWSLPLSCALLPGLSQAHLYLAADAGTGHFHASCPPATAATAAAPATTPHWATSWATASRWKGLRVLRRRHRRNDKQRQRIRAGGPTLGIASALPINPDWGLDFRLGLIDMTTAHHHRHQRRRRRQVQEGRLLRHRRRLCGDRLRLTLGLLGSRAVWHGGSAKVHNLGLGLRGDF
jgi:hypothetical protein